MSFLSEMDVETGFVAAVRKDKGVELNEAYRTAEPFPHIAIENFLPPEILEVCLAEFPHDPDQAAAAFNRDQERLKFQFNPDTLTPRVRSLFYSFNSLPFIQIIQNITGIKGLIPDPYFMGGGFHEIRNGGHLSIHADFNHHKPMGLERRINVLIYLNKDWDESYGGQIELWNKDMSQCAKSYTPAFNRCVIFNTTDESFHGNPNVVQNPLGKTRKSIALYYYTATWTGTKRERTTNFQARKGTDDKGEDVSVRTRELVTDLVPPILLRTAKRLAGRKAS